MAAGGEGKDAVRSGGRDYLVAVVADEETVAGFLLAGIGHRDAKGATYMVVGAGACGLLRERRAPRSPGAA